MSVLMLVCVLQTELIFCLHVSQGRLICRLSSFDADSSEAMIRLQSVGTDLVKMLLTSFPGGTTSTFHH